MVKLTKIYTRGGDGGESSLVDGSRVPKHHARFEAIGTVDEANAAIGLAAVSASTETGTLLKSIQNDLFDLGADLATPDDQEGEVLRITEKQTTRLETVLDDLTKNLAPLESFVLPGGSETTARLHLARTITRRAERCVSKLMSEATIGPETLKYLNRLSDLLFQLARAENEKNGTKDVFWQPGESQSK